MKNQKGLTIVELLVAIVIIAIISGFTIIAVGRYLTSSKLKMDQQIVVSLNEATTGYYLINNLSTIFPEDSSNEENIETLYNEGFLSSVATPNSEDSEFLWDSATNIWYLSIDGTASALSPYGTTPSEISPSIITDIQNFYSENGSYARTWGDYKYTDIGLDPEDWGSPIMHIYYKPSGSKLYLEPEDGYQFVLNNSDGDEFVLKSSYNWNLIYDDTSGKWYYHTIESKNEVLFSTLVVEAS